MRYDTIIIGAGLSGLTAASLLAKRGLRAAVIDNNYNPGGSCGTFKRNGVIFDQGSSMLYGFGEKGFSPHRFVFNCLEEPIDMIRHDLLYVVNYRSRNIRFFADLDRFIEELGEVFPSEALNIRRFYKDMARIYQDVMVDSPSFTTPDETDPRHALHNMRKHPVSYLKFLSYLNRSAENMLKRYFSDPEIFKFFNKLTSTYCYTTVRETPAILAAIMFVDNHFGGSYYPAGSTVFLPGKLEKVIEENGGEMIMNREVVRIDFRNGGPSGVTLDNGDRLEAGEIIYSGTIWNLYGKLLPTEARSKKVSWVKNPVPTYPSVMIYTCVDSGVVPEDTQPVELLVGNPDEIDESEVTIYIPSIDDRTITPPGTHVVMAIGPSLGEWDRSNNKQYAEGKKAEEERLLNLLERRFPGFRRAMILSDLATPATIERYLLKNGGAVAGPKQQIGQHMFKRLHTRSEWKNLFYCGESATMGTGTPAVTVSGLAAANAVLKKRGLEPFRYRPGMKEYVRIVPRPYLPEHRYADESPEARKMMLEASRCLYCERPTCSDHRQFDVRGIMRRLTVGNITGARKLIPAVASNPSTYPDFLSECETNCVLSITENRPIRLGAVMEWLGSKSSMASE
jgi:prolycopene isomerase